MPRCGGRGRWNSRTAIAGHRASGYELALPAARGTAHSVALPADRREDRDDASPAAPSRRPGRPSGFDRGSLAPAALLDMQRRVVLTPYVQTAQGRAVLGDAHERWAMTQRQGLLSGEGRKEAAREFVRKKFKPSRCGCDRRAAWRGFACVSRKQSKPASEAAWTDPALHPDPCRRSHRGGDCIPPIC